MPKIDYRRSALRILFILVMGSEADTNDVRPEFVRVFDGETRVQALDFWVRYPDYLADELLTLYGTTSDPTFRDWARKIFDNEEPDLRSVPMLRKYFGAYEPLDTVLGILKSRNLVLPQTKPMHGFANHQIFLVSKKACDLVAGIPSKFPELGWYADRVDLVLKVAGDRGGGALKERQHKQKEYHDTKHGDLIPTIAERVRLRLQELEKVDG